MELWTYAFKQRLLESGALGYLILALAVASLLCGAVASAKRWRLFARLALVGCVLVLVTAIVAWRSLAGPAVAAVARPAAAASRPGCRRQPARRAPSASRCG